VTHLQDKRRAGETNAVMVIWSSKRRKETHARMEKEKTPEHEQKKQIDK